MFELEWFHLTEKIGFTREDVVDIGIGLVEGSKTW